MEVKHPITSKRGPLGPIQSSPQPEKPSEHASTAANRDKPSSAPSLVGLNTPSGTWREGSSSKMSPAECQLAQTANDDVAAAQDRPATEQLAKDAELAQSADPQNRVQPFHNPDRRFWHI